MNILRNRCRTSLLSLSLAVGVFSAVGCDSTPGEGSLPKMEGPAGKAGKQAAIERMQGGGKMTAPNKKTKVVDAAESATAEPAK